MRHRLRLAYLVSHPIQYQAPLLRRVAAEPDIDLLVLFGSDFSARGYKDAGFGVEVAWDVPLLEGYRSRVLPAIRDNGTVSSTTPFSRGLLRALRGPVGGPAFDALWVHGYASLNALQGIYAAHSLGIPVLLRAESWAGDRPRSGGKVAAKKAFFHMLRPMITATLPVGTRNRQYWEDAFGPGMPQFSVPYAVDNAFFARQAEAAISRIPALRHELELDPNRPIILFASKLQERKHADHLLEALLLLLQRSERAPYLLIAGDGEQRDSLEAFATEKGLRPHTRFLGFRNQSELPVLFALAQVFVLPSRREPWGLIVNEAMAAGCPVVASSDVGAAPDLIQDGVNGYIYPVGDVHALADALDHVIHSPEVAGRFRQAAAERMRTWDFEADIRGLRAALAFATGVIRP